MQGVYNELREALGDLVEKGNCMCQAHELFWVEEKSIGLIEHFFHL